MHYSPFVSARVSILPNRRTTFVEIMCPIFASRALAICYPSFGESVSGWGINHVWPRLLGKHGGRLAIIDEISVTHTKALGSGILYQFLQDRGIDPTTERAEVMARHGIEAADIRELSRVHRSVLRAILYRMRRFFL
jgi:enoyl-CoA hydratase/carnithine racemase